MSEGKELFHGWDIEAIWEDGRLRPIDCNLLIHLIKLTHTMEPKQLPDGSIAYETPIPWLVEQTKLSDGGIHTTLQKLQECGYIRVVQIPGKRGRICGHVIFTDLHRIVNADGISLLKNVQITPIDGAPNGMSVYQIQNNRGFGTFYVPEEKEGKKGEG